MENLKKIGSALLMLAKSIVILFAAILVTVFIKTSGTVYAFIYSIIFLFIDPSKVINLWVVYIEGMIKNLAWFITKTAVYLDLCWNIGGSSELIEDFTTYKENSWFNRPLTTVSASIGRHEINDELVETGQSLSNLLNIVFAEKTHAASSYRKELMIKRFNEKEFGTSDRLM